MSESETGQSQTRRKADHLAQYRWKPGQPGNPTGKQGDRIVKARLRIKLAEPLDPNNPDSITKLDAILDTLIDKCIAGDSKLIAVVVEKVDPRELQTYIDGRQVHLHSDGDGPRVLSAAEANALIDEARLLAPIEPRNELGTYPEDQP